VPAGPLGFELRHVRVRAPGGESLVLDDCDLRVAPGEVVALVGATGSGKSTLTGLLPRLVDPDAGQVLVGARDVCELDLGDLRRHVHVVAQEAFLFSDTVRANLLLGAPGASEADLTRALALAQATDIVAGLPEGLETRIGDRGVTLSGGQRQRLTLARAFVARPAVLVLDDATSALDAVTERAIFEGLRLSPTGEDAQTILIVASKPSTVRLADRAVLLQAGRVAASGSHADLARDHAAYRELLGIDAHAAAAA
jgi:ATP-binding cassette, subfamily B, bacterial